MHFGRKISHEKVCSNYGEDNIVHIDKWKNGDYIIDNYPIYVYPRPNIPHSKFHDHNNVTIIEDVPRMEVSSTFIRKNIKAGKDVRYLLPNKAWEYVEEMNFYK